MSSSSEIWLVIIIQQQSQKYFPSFIYFLQCGISLINSWHLGFSVPCWLECCYSDIVIYLWCWIIFTLILLGWSLLERHHNTWERLKHPYLSYISLPVICGHDSSDDFKQKLPDVWVRKPSDCESQLLSHA